MKKIILACLAVAFGFASATYAQTTTIDISGNGVGLENLIVVKEDASAVGAGYSRYRIFVDLADNYGISLVTGTPTVGEMYFRSTGANGFYNTPTYGSLLGTSFPEVYFGIEPLVDYDSYATIGYMGSDRLAVRNAQGYVLNVGGAPTVAQAGMSGANAFTNADDFSSGTTGATFNPDGGSFPAGFSNAAYGNEILVAQVTCDGELEFQFAVGVKDAGQNQTISAPISFSTANAAPTISIATVDDLSALRSGDTFSASATVADADADAPYTVRYFLDGVQYPDASTVFTTAPYNVTVVSPTVGAVAENFSLSATVVDARGAEGNTTSNILFTVNPNTIPVASLSVAQAPDGDFTYDLNAELPILVTVNATDGDSDPISQIEIFVNGGSEIVVPNPTLPYTYSFSPVAAGDYSITAVASDAQDSDPTAPVVVTVFDANTYYELGEEEVISVPCYASNNFCVPLTRVNYPLANPTPVTGFDMIMEFDAAKVVPTGVVSINPAAHTGLEGDADYAWRVEGDGAGQDSLFLSVFMKGSGSENYVWDGQGEIVCVEFAKTTSFASNDAVVFSLPFLRESFELSNADVDETLINVHTFETYLDNIFHAQLNFWADGSPIQGTEADGFNSARMRDGASATVPGYYAEPDINGHVAYDWIAGGTTAVRIEKQIDNDMYDGDTILSLFGGQDALLTQKVLVNDPSFIPSAYQMVAMDVNKDGKVTAGDVSQINQRAVQLRQEFSNGTGMDWEFVALSDYVSQVRYKISSTYPLDDGTGRYSKENVPNPTNYNGLAALASEDCPVPPTETFIMILLGDVDGSYKDLEHVAPTAGTAGSSQLKSLAVESGVVFDLANATYEEDFVNVPVMINGEDAINAVDFAIMVDTEKLQFMSVTNMQKVESLSNSFNTNVWNTSYSLESYNTEEPVFSIRFMSNGTFSNSDFTYASAFINGKKVAVSFTKAVENATAVELNEMNVNLYPNPASNRFFVEVTPGASIELIDINGRVLRTLETVVDRTEISTEGLTSGVYIVRVANGDALTVKRVIIE